VSPDPGAEPVVHHPGDVAGAAHPRQPEPAPEARPRFALPFQARLAIYLVLVSIVPLAVFGILMIATGLLSPTGGTPILLFALAITGALGILVAPIVAVDLSDPVRTLAAAIARVGAGERAEPVAIAGSDALARLAESHNRLAGDIERRNRQLAEILTAVAKLAPVDGVDDLLERAAGDATSAFGLLDVRIRLVDPATITADERVPGEPLPVRAEIRAGADRLGLLQGHLPATRDWEPADQALLDLFAREVGVAIRNAELFARVEVQNSQLRELAEAKDDFLRGVSHNLQTPLTSIRLLADQLATGTGDRRAEIVGEQADRLSRMVRQLLTVSRLESGAIRPRSEVLALAPRVRRAWEAIGVRDVDLQLDDQSLGWLAIGDADQLDQVLWALLDNAVKHGAGPIEASVAVDPGEGRIVLRIADHGPGIAMEDRDRLFGRFARGSALSADGSGLGLYVARELMRGMHGDLVLEDPPAAGGSAIGASFRLSLPAEPPLET
jgi:signal transduction histidine kinase